ncbi:unnamed protein product [Ranitomeya imitator]|uniref:Uncharacterized protein n=1 Tax=Ranitomeya imitator TaxID=111125 RepID=A0ABN9MFI3_9NEOB|nr:unnamed protein product [Ranitomeya imitator]
MEMVKSKSNAENKDNTQEGPKRTRTRQRRNLNPINLKMASQVPLL